MAKLRFVIRDRQMSQIEALLDDGETVGQFMRRSIEREIERRDIKTRRDVAELLQEWAASEAARKEPLL